MDFRVLAVNISELRKSQREVCMSLLSQLKHTSAYAGTTEFKKDFLRKLALPEYLGDKHVCPVCETHLRAFGAAAFRKAGIAQDSVLYVVKNRASPGSFHDRPRKPDLLRA